MSTLQAGAPQRWCPARACPRPIGKAEGRRLPVPTRTPSSPLGGAGFEPFLHHAGLSSPSCCSRRSATPKTRHECSPRAAVRSSCEAVPRGPAVWQVAPPGRPPWRGRWALLGLRRLPFKAPGTQTRTKFLQNEYIPVGLFIAVPLLCAAGRGVCSWQAWVAGCGGAAVEGGVGARVRELLASRGRAVLSSTSACRTITFTHPAGVFALASTIDTQKCYRREHTIISHKFARSLLFVIGRVTHSMHRFREHPHTHNNAHQTWRGHSSHR